MLWVGAKNQNQWAPAGLSAGGSLLMPAEHLSPAAPPGLVRLPKHLNFLSERGVQQ